MNSSVHDRRIVWIKCAGAIALIAVNVFALSSYSVKQILAAELIFAAVFVLFVLLVAVSYALGSVAELCWKWFDFETRKLIHHSHRLHQDARAGILLTKAAGRHSSP